MHAPLPGAGLPSPGVPPTGRIDVWQVDLDARPRLELDGYLSPEEHARAARYRFERDAVRFRHCRAMLRLGMAWYLKKPPQSIVIETGWRGKPYLPGGSLHFNLSHSGPLALLAFTAVGEVGVDVEQRRQTVEAEQLASAYFTQREAAGIATASAPEAQANLFLRLWTRKEAVMKAAGCGIADGLDTVDVWDEHGTSPQGFDGLVKLHGAPGFPQQTRWQVRDLDATLALDSGFAALAAPPGNWPIFGWTVALEEVLDHSKVIFRED